MTRILCILSSLDAGGAETFVMKIYRALAPEQYQIDFIVSVDGGCYTDEVLARGGKIYKIPMRTKDFWGAFQGIRSVVKNNHYDTVLKLGENALAVTDLIAAKLGGARNRVLRSCNAPTGLSFKMRLVHGCLKPLLNVMATHKIAPSQLASDFMFGKRVKTTLVKNGVDLDVYQFDEDARSRIRAEFGIGQKLVVGHIGRFVNQKNHRYLLRVFQQMHKQRPDAVLMLVGIGELERQIRQQITEMGLQDYVIFTGQRFDIPALLSAMDVFVFPSFHEGMPNTVIEAQATGLPCIIANTITQEADITGLVHYLSLEETPECWASTALSRITKDRRCTKVDFRNHGYDIKSVAMDLVNLICK